MSKNRLKLNKSCPRCGNAKIIDYFNLIYCPVCKLDFDKKFLGVFDNKNILSLQELGGIVGIFDENENKKA
ncbi:MAG: hypothetical protein ACFFCE_00340 [Promethearchaeota archaeon]